MRIELSRIIRRRGNFADLFVSWWWSGIISGYWTSEAKGNWRPTWSTLSPVSCPLSRSSVGQFRSFVTIIRIIKYFFDFSFRDKMAMVAHLVGIDQLGYEKELGMTPSVSFLGRMHSSFSHLTLFFPFPGHEEWQVVAGDAAEGQWRRLGRGRGRLEGHEEGPARGPWWVSPDSDSLPINAFCIFIWWIEKVLISEF